MIIMLSIIELSVMFIILLRSNVNCFLGVLYFREGK